MFWNRYFRPSFILMLVVVALHWLASINGWYWTTNWYDSMMHLLGGLWVFLFALWVAHTKYAQKFLKDLSVRNLLIFVLVVGVLWEIHEIVFGFTDFFDPGYPLDTTKDLVMDMLGGALGAFIYKKRWRTQV